MSSYPQLFPGPFEMGLSATTAKRVPGGIWGPVYRLIHWAPCPGHFSCPRDCFRFLGPLFCVVESVLSPLQPLIHTLCPQLTRTALIMTV